MLQPSKLVQLIKEKRFSKCRWHLQKTQLLKTMYIYLNAQKYDILKLSKLIQKHGWENARNEYEELISALF